MPSNAKRRRLSLQAEEERKKELNSARVKLFGLILLMMVFVVGEFTLPLKTTPIWLFAVFTIGAIASLIAIFVIAQPILRDLRENPRQ